MNERQKKALRNVLREIVRFTDRPDYSIGDLNKSMDALIRPSGFASANELYTRYSEDNEKLD